MDLQLASVARVNRAAGAEPRDLAGAADPARVRHAVNHSRRDRAAAIAERQPHGLDAVAAPANVDLAHEQRLCDLYSVCKLTDFHRATKIAWSADSTCAMERMRS